tara:strand:- start:4 stop:618 length:615 start_codon:yes stop_codon:yes gene_type:complete
MKILGAEEFYKPYVFNKSKANTVIFIHGLFGRSGFWLPFLSFFDNYKIVILDINYSQIFKYGPYRINLELDHGLLLKENDEYIVISHSIGTVIAQFFPHGKIKGSYEICPVYDANRINNEGFVSEIQSRIGLPESEISKTLLNSEIFIESSILFFNTLMNKIQYVPSKDDYFEYNKNGKRIKKFDGNHFDILNSISMINKHLKE